MGEKWNGTSHESDVPGCIHHSLPWITAECDRRGLIVAELGRDKTYGQSWLEIKRRKYHGASCKRKRDRSRIVLRRSTGKISWVNP